MDAAWKNKFAPKVLERGQQCFTTGCVQKLKQDSNTIRATVNGTTRYDVTIHLSGDLPKTMECTCPFADDGANCKHMAAVLFAVEAGEFSFTEEPDEEIDETIFWQRVFQQLPGEILYRELLRTTLRDQELQERLLIRLTGKLPDGMLKDWEKLLKRYSKNMAIGSKYIDYDSIPRYIQNLTEFLDDRLSLLKEVNAVMDGFLLVGLVFDIAFQRIQNHKDEELLKLIGYCEKEWLLAFEYATAAEKKKMHDWYWAHFARFRSYCDLAITVPFFYLSWSKTLNKKSLSLLDNRINACTDEKERSFLIDCRIMIMQQLGSSPEEDRAFWEKHLQYDSSRHRLLEDYYNEGKYQSIVELLRFMKTIDNEDPLRLLTDGAWLLQMYRQLAREDEYAQELNFLIVTGRHVLEELLPNVINRTTARTFVAHLNAIRSCKDESVLPMLDEIVDKLCSNPAIAKKGIIEIVMGAGYEWPKPYRFPKK